MLVRVRFLMPSKYPVIVLPSFFYPTSPEYRILSAPEAPVRIDEEEAISAVAGEEECTRYMLEEKVLLLVHIFYDVRCEDVDVPDGELGPPISCVEGDEFIRDGSRVSANGPGDRRPPLVLPIAAKRIQSGVPVPILHRGIEQLVYGVCHWTTSNFARLLDQHQFRQRAVERTVYLRLEKHGKIVALIVQAVGKN